MDGFPRKHDKKAWVLVKCFSQCWGKFQNGSIDTTRQAFSNWRKRRAANSKSFETKVAQAAALSTILFRQGKQRPTRGSLNSSDKSNFSKLFEISSKTCMFEDFKASVSGCTVRPYTFFFDFLGLYKPSINLFAILIVYWKQLLASSRIYTQRGIIRLDKLSTMIHLTKWAIAIAHLNGWSIYFPLFIHRWIIRWATVLSRARPRRMIRLYYKLGQYAPINHADFLDIQFCLSGN